MSAALPFLPESPRWLMMCGDEAAARHELVRLRKGQSLETLHELQIIRNYARHHHLVQREVRRQEHVDLTVRIDAAGEQENIRARAPPGYSSTSSQLSGVAGLLSGGLLSGGLLSGGLLSGGLQSGRTSRRMGSLETIPLHTPDGSADASNHRRWQLPWSWLRKREPPPESPSSANHTLGGSVPSSTLSTNIPAEGAGDGWDAGGGTALGGTQPVMGSAQGSSPSERRAIALAMLIHALQAHT